MLVISKVFLYCVRRYKFHCLLHLKLIEMERASKMFPNIKLLNYTLNLLTKIQLRVDLSSM